MVSFSVIVTAGGIGSRMKASVPKQFLLVNDRPLLMYTIELFYKFNQQCQIILTLPKDWINYWEEIVRDHDFQIPHRIVEGGEQRYHSVKNALEYCQSSYIAVHDGVRPLVGYHTLKRLFEGIKSEDALIPVVPVVESLRRKKSEKTEAVDRSEFVVVQTPQFFKSHVLKKAYQREYHYAITDDASLVEEAGFTVSTTDGNIENIKVTEQSDLRYAELFLK